jgi:predicted O-methyltransferase YrrM
MQEDFERIFRAYSQRRGKLVMESKAQRPTSAGYWASSDPNQLFELFRKIELRKYKRFLDLGSGDGIVVAIASLFTKASGIEVDAELHKNAGGLKHKLGLQYSLKNCDYLDEDLSAYDVIFINPDNYFYKLEKKLVEEFRGTLVIADNIFRPLTFSPDKQLSIRGAGFSVYTLNR